MVDHRPSSSRSSLSDPHGAGLPLSLVMDPLGGDRPSDSPALTGLASFGSADPLPHPESGPVRQRREGRKGSGGRRGHAIAWLIDSRVCTG